MKTAAAMMLSLLLASSALAQTTRPSPATAPTISTAPAPASLRVFHVGNSLTFGVLQPGVARKILSSRGTDYQFGWHILWGASLAAIWDKADQPAAKTDRYGPFKEALADHEWDALTLQPWAATLEGDAGDLAVARKFIDLALKKSPRVRVYIYETWPSKDADGKLDFAAKWTRPYRKGRAAPALYCGGYCKELVHALNQDLPDLAQPVRLIPVGSVMFELDKAMKAGKVPPEAGGAGPATVPAVPGLTRIEDVYKDAVHLNAVGNYIALCTYAAVLLKQDPRGLPGPAYDKAVTDELAKVIQETVWKVVTAEPLTGLGGPTTVPATRP